MIDPIKAGGFKFSTEMIEVPVVIDETSYTLKEATGEQAAKWRNAVLDCGKWGPDGKPRGVKGLALTESLLVSLCLVNDVDGNNVPVEVIRSWPSRIVLTLFEKAKEISGLEDVEVVEADAKNLQGEKKDGSD